MDSISSKNWKLWWYAMHPETAPDLRHGGPDTTMSCAYLGHTSLPDARRAGSGQPYPGRTWQVHSGSAWSAQTLVEGPCSHGSLEQETTLKAEESKKGACLLNPRTYIIYSSCCFYYFGSITSPRYIRLWFYFKIYFTSYPCCVRVWMHVSVWSQCVSWSEAKSGEYILFFHHGLWGSNWGCQGCADSTSPTAAAHLSCCALPCTVACLRQFADTEAALELWLCLLYIVPAAVQLLAAHSRQCLWREYWHLWASWFGIKILGLSSLTSRISLAPILLSSASFSNTAELSMEDTTSGFCEVFPFPG